MSDRLRFFLSRLGERLWVKPLGVCTLSVGAVFLAKWTDRLGLEDKLPSVTLDSVDTLLTTMSASMLVIATFAVASMVSAYASAANEATPRTFTLVVSDDVSQNALSTFVGAFIFSIVAIITLKNSYYGEAGRFTLFAMTLLVFAIVIGVFVRWVDRIARLGRVGSTIEKVERATAESLRRRRGAPTLRATPVGDGPPQGSPLYGSTIGYVQHVDIEKLQSSAERAKARIRVTTMPGALAAPGRPLAWVTTESGELSEKERTSIEKAFLIGDQRVFDDDPRFGLIVLSEVASRALSPGINDPGTAIDITGRLVRLFVLWIEPPGDELKSICYERVQVPEIELADMFDDAFTPIARDGAAIIEVVVRLLKVLHALASAGDDRMRELAMRHARVVLARAEIALDFEEDRELARDAAAFGKPGTPG